ncbi:DUF1287 domain-containing protein [Xanthomonas sp. NCPPB 2654]|uniref:DUF1287 domain-containing protein n=2 Tax=Xanthomonas TaxID=338 RepID=UPI00256EED5E|nr:DUF1287 domain-containing protein [Xanthomonas sp. NCPPB 2654]MDL5366881.1 DUF1287 domain-containing protein [Xanthomonas sp. NCPPB 2654]MDR6672410.1 uncharacterized protein YijF (DUF1287 family) [Xanthomonas translucens]
MPNFRATFGISICIALAIAACKPQQEGPAPAPRSATPPDSAAHSPARPGLPADVRTIIAASRERMSLGEVYDPKYYTMAYPGGDVANDRGVCTDVVIRAYRHLGIDFQQLIHEDMRRDFSAYPQLWGSQSTDRNIDHRRVPNIERFLTRKGASLPISDRAVDYRPGDLVTWRLAGGLPHIGIVSDRHAPSSDRLLILHNIGAGTAEDDVLFSYPIVGHFRYYPDGA